MKIGREDLKELLLLTIKFCGTLGMKLNEELLLQIIKNFSNREE